MLRTAIIGLALAAASGTAAAQTSPTPQSRFAGACSNYAGSDLPNDEVLASIIATGSPSWSAPLVRAYNATLAGVSTPTNPNLADQFLPGNGTWDSLLREIHSDEFPEQTQRRTDQIQISRRTRGLDAQAWVRAYLGGEVGLITVHCPLAKPDEPATSAPRRLIITGDIAGLSAARLDQRTFGTISYTNDRVASTESFNVDVVLGLGAFDIGAARVVPYLSYERESLGRSPVNDLTLGATGFWQRDFHEVRWNAAYETDDEFDSSMWMADVEWEPAPIRACTQRIGRAGMFQCEYGLRLDYSYVEDPGSKASLANVENYLRAGGWLGLSYGQPLWRGWFEARLRYALMEPLTGEEGDVARGEVNLTLSPRETSNYEFGIGYVNGEDLTSLVRSETIKVFLGIRY